MNNEVALILKNENRIKSYVKDQLGRASQSVMLNIAEGAGKITSKDKKYYYSIARGSVFETISLIQSLESQEWISTDIMQRMYQEYEEISKMLFVMIRNLK